jgi:hypothetical protein
MYTVSQDEDPPSGRTTRILNVRLPIPLYDEFVAEAGPGYGARSDLMRRMIQFWLSSVDARTWKSRYQSERSLRIQAEAKLSQIAEIAKS